MNVRIVVHITDADSGYTTDPTILVEAFYDGIRRFAERVTARSLFVEADREALLRAIDVGRHRPSNDPLKAFTDAARDHGFEVHTL